MASAMRDLCKIAELAETTQAVLRLSRSFRALETCFRGYKKQHLRISIYLPSNSNIFLWIHLYVGLVLSNSVI